MYTPSFVEIIKQLSPDEAKIMSLLTQIQNAPVIWLNSTATDGLKKNILIRNFTLLGEKAQCTMPEMTPAYIDNLARLKLIYLLSDEYFSDESVYNPLYEHPEIKRVQLIPLEDGRIYSIIKGYLILSVFGQAFCKICVLD